MSLKVTFAEMIAGLWCIGIGLFVISTIAVIHYLSKIFPYNGGHRRGN